jgi:hypothetical protein
MVRRFSKHVYQKLRPTPREQAQGARETAEAGCGTSRENAPKDGEGQQANQQGQVMIDEHNNPVCIANIGGQLVKYDAACSYRRKAYDSKVFRYIGKGFIHSVGGVKQGYTEKDVCYFWVIRDDKS